MTTITEQAVATQTYKAPHLLVQTWSPHFDLATSAEPPKRR